MTSMVAPRGEGESERTDASMPPLLLDHGMGTARGIQSDARGAILNGGWGLGGWLWWKGLWLLVAVIGLLVVAHFPPDQYGFYPRCTLFRSTGLLCPGCGSFRALHALTQGDWVYAVQSNALLTIGMPLLALGWLARMWGRGRLGVRLKPSGWAGWMALSVVLLFGLLRNLPGPFSRWLVP